MSFKPESCEVPTEGLVSDALFSSETVTQIPVVYWVWDCCQCLIENCFVKKAQCIKTFEKSNKSGNLITGALRSSLEKRSCPGSPCYQGLSSGYLAPLEMALLLRNRNVVMVAVVLLSLALCLVYMKCSEG